MLTPTRAAMTQIAAAVESPSKQPDDARRSRPRARAACDRLDDTESHTMSIRSRCITRPSTATTGRHAVAAGRPPAAGAALPHADPQLLAARSSRPSTSSTGSRTRTATTSPGSSSRSRRSDFVVEVDLVAEMIADQPVRLLRRGVRASSIPFAYDAGAGQRAASRTSRSRPAGPQLHATGRRDAPRQASQTIDYLVELNQRAAAARSLRHPHGAGRPDAARRR